MTIDSMVPTENQSEERSVSSNNYHPYSLREFTTNIGKGNYKKFGGLGANMGTE